MVPYIYSHLCGVCAAAFPFLLHDFLLVMMSGQPNTDYTTIQTDKGTSYLCTICPLARGAKDWRVHCKSKTHQLNLARRQELEHILSTNEGGMIQHDANLEDSNDNPIQESEEDQAHMERVWLRLEDLLHHRTDSLPERIIRTLDEELDELEARVPVNRTPEDHGQVANWETILEDELESIESDEDNHMGVEPPPIIRVDKRSDRVNTCKWYPFKSKLDLIASLIIGHTHSMLSRVLYTKIRAILTLCGLVLPAWATVRASRARISGLLGTKLRNANSVFDTPCYALSAKTILSQELANPHVSKHLEFFPEDTNGMNMSRFSQSYKWLSGIPRENRLQMCEVNGKQFYIYEPVQLVSHEVVIPIFLYKSNTEIKSKCVRIKAEHIKKEKHITEGVTTSIIKITVPFPLPFYDPRLSTIPVTEFDSDYSTIRWVDGKFIIDACKGFIYEQRLKEVNKIPFPNPWRVKANGKIIRHCPIVLYSDDTSGNVSKQFNKHISFYFTLAGLPPHISNQEYNCHFLATSNLASVCEMLEMIVQELNELATVGFEAYDHSISQVVLVTSTVLCFVADSPMHAEITNTPNPGGVDKCTPTPMAHANLHAKRRLACAPARQSAAG
ncbi:hypothetical protein PGT21_009069 [Puccinia graminis f. sp. tritici]|uniref:U1-type domain-containing protein n=1 Tax=Puccinia graminis f. sp. tritici TaxID=56615 RepID=A0A5B0N249_PUCGR|nr:hypothetical protein PGT21_009069 [Puccinia graminis f. sp. tritici]KAA1133464.1 hypothetical protein PGTUg99_015096 [Puccinia graminis f. sp. tritici]